jgi:hypothetical protein
MTARTRNYIQDKGYDAAAPITKYRAVKWSAEEVITPVTAGATDIVAGIPQESASALDITHGKGVPLAVEGDTEWECSAALAVGTRVACANDGTCIASVAGSKIHGWVVEPTTATGQRARVHLSLNGDPTT